MLAVVYTNIFGDGLMSRQAVLFAVSDGASAAAQANVGKINVLARQCGFNVAANEAFAGKAGEMLDIIRNAVLVARVNGTQVNPPTVLVFLQAHGSRESASGTLVLEGNDDETFQVNNIWKAVDAGFLGDGEAVSDRAVTPYVTLMLQVCHSGEPAVKEGLEAGFASWFAESSTYAMCATFASCGNQMSSFSGHHGGSAFVKAVYELFGGERDIIDFARIPRDVLDSPTDARQWWTTRRAEPRPADFVRAQLVAAHAAAVDGINKELVAAGLATDDDDIVPSVRFKANEPNDVARMLYAMFGHNPVPAEAAAGEGAGAGEGK